MDLAIAGALDASGDALPVAGGPPGLSLWHRRLDWICAGTRLDLHILAAEPVALPGPEPSEPAAGALARVLRSTSGAPALVLLANPAQAFGRERMLLAAGVRLLGIAGAEDEACWDALLGHGQPSYGVRGTLHLSVMNPRPAGVLSALAYGSFTCREGLDPLALDESPRGVSWRLAAPATATVVVRGGFEVARLDGDEGAYADTGAEGSVRVVLRDGPRACWTQPRFVAPVRGSSPSA